MTSLILSKDRMKRNSDRTRKFRKLKEMEASILEKKPLKTTKLYEWEINQIKKCLWNE